MLSTISSTELLLGKGGAGGRFASGDLDAASERSLSAPPAGAPTHKPAQPLWRACPAPRNGAAQGPAFRAGNPPQTPGRPPAGAAPARARPGRHPCAPSRQVAGSLRVPAPAHARGRVPVRAGSSAHAAHAASAFSVHCTPRKALHASLAQQAAERRAGGLRPAAPSAGSAEGDRRAAEAEAGAAGADGASPGEWADAGADGAPRAGPRLAQVERGGSGASTSGRTGSGAIELPVLPWSDWEIPADEIRICRRPNGAEWELGSGAFGKARRSWPACAFAGRGGLAGGYTVVRLACMSCPCFHARPMVLGLISQCMLLSRQSCQGMSNVRGVRPFARPPAARGRPPQSSLC